jgi:hypothetical protein
MGADDGHVRRSWYMPRAAADGLSDLVDDIHHSTRAPKAAVLAAVVAVARQHADQVRAQLAELGAETSAETRTRA